MDKFDELLNNIDSIKKSEENHNRLLNWLEKEKKKDIAIINRNKELFIGELKNSLGQEIKTSDHKPKKIKVSVWQKIINFFLWLRTMRIGTNRS